MDTINTGWLCEDDSLFLFLLIQAQYYDGKSVILTMTIAIEYELLCTKQWLKECKIVCIDNKLPFVLFNTVSSAIATKSITWHYTGNWQFLGAYAAIIFKSKKTNKPTAHSLQHNLARSNCVFLMNEVTHVDSPIRSGHPAAALRSGRRALQPGWTRRRCPLRPRRPRCWSPGLWSLCGAPPSWVPCTDSSDSTWARGSRWIAACSSGGHRGGQ